ncbi:hypothetical protein ACFFKU_06365 [Kineococcus gynurae]|uniref:Integral membrane protein n=1 Tax=Kineococcus gynurae TaxID=452979 RepID=A0ABV5LX80_9ACTN
MSRPPALTVVALLVVLEALLLVAAAVYEVWGLVRAPEEAFDPVAAAALAAMALLFAAGLLLCARGLRDCASWARSPVVVWQVLQLAVGIPAFGAGVWWAGVAIGLPAVLTLVGLFLPSVVAATRR